MPCTTAPICRVANFSQNDNTNDGDDYIKKTLTYFKAIRYSTGLFYRSSGFTFLLYFFLILLCRSVDLLKIYTLRNILNIATTESAAFNEALIYTVIYIAWIVLLQALNSSASIVKNSIMQKANHQYSIEVSKQLTKIPLSILDTSYGRSLIDYVKKSQATSVNVVYRLINIVSYVYTFCIAFGSLLALDVWFSLLFLVLTVPGIIINNMFNQKADEFQRKTAPDVRKFHYYRWMLTDVWPAKDVRMYDLTEPIKSRYDDEKESYRIENKKLHWNKFCAGALIGLIALIGDIVFTVFVIAKSLSGEIPVGDVALYIGLAVSATAYFQTMLTIFLDGFTMATKRMGQVFGFFNIGIPNSNRTKRTLNQFESLSFENVYFKYPMTSKYILSNASFSLHKGDKISLVGINGAGKTTIIKLMLGLYEIESGQILINGYPISDYDIHDVRKMFSVLFQDFAQYPLTLRDNVALSNYCSAENDDEIIAALKKSDVYDDIVSKTQNGIDSNMTRQFDDNGIELSKGQWQKIALSRVYFKDTPIIIFDEPSAALDAEAEDRIFKSFETLSADKTGIIISHRISSARMSDKIIVLDGGMIIEQGTHNELVSLGGLYAKLYNLQRNKYIAGGDII